MERMKGIAVNLSNVVRDSKSLGSESFYEAAGCQAPFFRLRHSVLLTAVNRANGFLIREASACLERTRRASDF